MDPPFPDDLIRDEFLSEEDLDLRNLSWDELIAYWNLWLEQAQATNHLDEHEYSHGVFQMCEEMSLDEDASVSSVDGHGVAVPVKGMSNRC